MKLVYIGKVVEVAPIENADRIEALRVVCGSGGTWSGVAQKDQFSIGSSCEVYLSDSLLPHTERFAFMEKNSWRVRIMKLRGVNSEVLIMPQVLSGDIGDDVTDVSGVTRYEKPLPVTISGDILGHFPTFVPRTDEPNVQGVPEMVTMLQGKPFYATIKVDGCLLYRNMIKTDVGEIEIGRIVNQKMNVGIVTYNCVTKKTEIKKITNYHKYSTEDREVLRIGTGHRGHGVGRTKYIDCTTNHKFLTPTGWTEASSLSVGDTIFHYSDRLSFEAEQLILGTLLGDSSIRQEGECVFFEFGHSVVQSDYFEYKMRLLGQLVLETTGQRGGYPGSKENRRCYSISSLSIIKLIRDNCLSNGKKTVGAKWVDQMTPVALAFWYMDDGTLNFRDENIQLPRARFCTNAYSRDEVELLKKMLYQKYNIESEVLDQKGFVISLSTRGTEILFSLIAPYVCKSMKYKLSKKYELLPCIYENGYSFDVLDGIIETKVIEIKHDFPECYKSYMNWVYDLTVEDNHNYFASNILTHNSSATIFKWQGHFGVCSRNYELKPSDTNTLWQLARKYDLENKLPEGFSVQAEVCGPGIQSNSLGLAKVDMLCFNVYDITNKRYLDGYSASVFCTMLPLGLPFVEPIVTPETFTMNVDELRALVEKQVYHNGKPAEGIVVRPMREEEITIDNRLCRLSFKVVNPLYRD